MSLVKLANTSRLLAEWSLRQDSRLYAHVEFGRKDKLQIFTSMIVHSVAACWKNGNCSKVAAAT